MLKRHLGSCWTGGLLVAILVALSGTGCTKQLRKSRYLAHANADYKAGQYDRAEVEYLNVLRLDPSVPQAIERLGFIYYDEGRFLGALQFLQRAAELEPDNADVRLKLCVTRLSLARFKEAREDALKLLKQQPGQEEALSTLAEAAMNSKEVEDTRQQLERLRQADKDRAGYHLAKVVLLLKEGQATNALGELQQALALEPKSATVQEALGSFYWLQGNLQQAEPALKAAADLSPLRSPRKLRYAEFKRRQGSLAEARKCLEDLTRQAPDYLPAWLALGQIALEEGKLDECASITQRVLNRAPESIDGSLLKAKLKLAQGNGAEALTELTRLSESLQQSPEIQYELARAYLLQADVPKAISRLERAVSLKPNYPEANMALAQLRLSQGDAAGALPLFLALVKQQPQNAQASFLLAAAYLAQQSPAEAIAVYRRMLHDFPKAPQVPVALATVLAQQGQQTEARQLCQQALDLSPDFLPALQTLVDLDLADKQPQAALARVNQEIARQPSSAELQVLLARVHLVQQDLAGAEAPLVKATELAPDSRTACRLLAQLYVNTQRPQLALEKLNQFVARTNDAQVLLQLGTIEENLKNYTAARDAYEKLLSAHPKYSPALNNLAYVYAEYLNQPDKALEAAQSAHELLPNAPSTTDTLGWVWFRKGDALKALPLLEDAAAKDPAEPEIQYHLGMARYALGQEASARSVLQAAVNAGKDFRGKDVAQGRLTILAIDPKTASPDARALLEKRVADAPEDTVALSRLAGVYDLQGAVEKAASTYEQLLKQAPRNAPALARLSQLYAGPLKNPQKALDLAKDAHAADPANPAISQALGHLVLQTGDYKWAASLLEEASRSTPNQPDLCYDLAWARFGLGQLADATASLQTALAGGAASARAEEGKRFLALLGAYGDAVQRQSVGPQLDAALKADPNSILALLVQARQQQDRGSFPEAKKSLEQVLSLSSRCVPALRDYAVLCSARFPDEAKAYDAATKAREAFPDDPALATALGILSYGRANYTAAAQYLKQSLQARPGDSLTLYYLGMAQYQLKAGAESKVSLRQALALNLEPRLADQAKKVLTELK